MIDRIHYYFAYGSNMNPGRMVERDVRFEEMKAGVLQDYSLRFNKRSVSMHGSAAANVVHSPGDRVEGVLYRLVDADQIRRLDPFEGYPDGYRRELLEVLGDTLARVPAWVYLANAGYIDEALRPRRTYLEHLLAGRPFLSADYYRRLERVACDDDT